MIIMRNYMKYIYLLLATIAFASCSSDIISDAGNIPVEIVVEATSFEEKVQDVSTRASVNGVAEKRRINSCNSLIFSSAFFFWSFSVRWTSCEDSYQNS